MEESSRGVLADRLILFLVGLFVAIRIFVSLLGSFRFVYKTHIFTFLQKTSYKQKFGEWAVVTGCTSGIGESFVKELASHGINIVLVSRSLDKLNKQSVLIERKYGVKTKVVTCNYLDKEAYKSALEQTRQLNIGLLVNNVGLNTDTGSRRFDEMSFEEVRNMIVVNGGAATLMSRVFLPEMIASDKGYVLNIGSTSGYICLPFQALYCATKCYMRLWSLGLAEEIRNSRVSIQCSIPQFVRTGMCKGNDLLYNCPVWTCNPDVYARATLRTIDIPDTGAYFFYDYMIWFIKTVNAFVHKGVEATIVYWICCLLLPHCSKVKD